jgi:hypothetical protein
VRAEPKLYYHAGTAVDVFFFASFSMNEKANWKRRTEIIDYCVQVLDDRDRPSESDHQVESGETRTHPSLSSGVAGEAKVR